MTIQGEADAMELWQLLMGKQIGEGVFRKVYEMEFNPDMVLKVEQKPHSFHNIKEWENWDQVRWHSDLREWFAPCVAISKNGLFLIQKRTTPVTMDDMPAKHPACLTDTKVQNYGRYKGRIVCHDYGHLRTILKTNLIKADWWVDGKSARADRYT